MNQEDDVPIHRLPVELLLTILEDSLDEIVPLVPRLHALACVCRRWEAVILSSPTLWTLSSDADPHYSSTLTRSRDYLLDVRCREYTDDGLQRDFHKALRSHRNRWQSLDLHIVRSSEIAPWITYPMPNLRFLSIESYNPQWCPPMSLSDTPNLRRLLIVRLFLQIQGPHPWPLLRKLLLDQVNVGQWSRLMEIVADCTLLEDLELRDVKGGVTGLPSGPMTLNHLKRLCMHVQVGACINNIIQRLVAPSLQTLELDSPDMFERNFDAFSSENARQLLYAVTEHSAATALNVYISPDWVHMYTVDWARQYVEGVKVYFREVPVIFHGADAHIREDLILRFATSTMLDHPSIKPIRLMLHSTSREIFARLFSKMPSLTWLEPLVVTGSSLAPLLSYLEEVQSDGSWPCRRLTTLIVPPLEEQFPMDQQFMATLVQARTTAAKAGHVVPFQIEARDHRVFRGIGNWVWCGGAP